MTDNSYKNWPAISDSALIKHIGDFIKHHRLKQNLTQSNLATNAGVSRSTLSLLERGESVSLSTLIRTLRVLDQLHIMEVFNIQSSASPLKLAKMEQAKRQRARNKNQQSTENDW